MFKKHHNLILCIVITAVCLAFTFTRFNGVFETLIISVKEFGKSFYCYFYFIIFFKLPVTKDPVTNTPAPIDPIEPPTGKLDNILPNNTAELQSDFSKFWHTLFDGENFTHYAQSLDSILIFVVRLFPFFILFFVAVKRYLRRQFTAQNNDYNKDSKPLQQALLALPGN